MKKINSDNTSMFCYLCNKLAAMAEGLKINEFTSRCIVLLPLNDSGESLFADLSTTCGIILKECIEIPLP